MLVSVQTLRGTAGTQEAQKSVSAAVAKFNETSKVPHRVEFFQALPPNTKGMQFRLSLLAQLARVNGCNLIRLSVHNGEVALCGPDDQVQQVLDSYIDLHNVFSTKATSAFDPSTGSKRMAFMNGYTCGLTAGLFPGMPQLAYGIGTLFAFPKPGDGKAYDLGEAALDLEEAPAPAPRRSTKARSVKAA